LFILVFESGLRFAHIETGQRDPARRSPGNLRRRETARRKVPNPAGRSARKDVERDMEENRDAR